MQRKRSNDSMGYLHVYGQADWHDDVRIVGNEKALRALRDTIDAAIQRNDVVSAGAVFAADGEGYFVTVIPLDDPQAWKRMAVPYTDEPARETRKKAVWPEQIIMARGLREWLGVD